MYYFLLIAIFLFNIPGLEANIDQRRVDVAKELLSLTLSKKSFEQFEEELTERTKDIILRADPSIGDDPDLATLLQRAKKIQKSHVPYKSLMEEAAYIYAEEFSIEELEEMLAFYRSDLGSTVMKSMPKVMQKTKRMLQAEITAAMPKMEQDIMHLVEKHKVAPLIPPGSQQPDLEW